MKKRDWSRVAKFLGALAVCNVLYMILAILTDGMGRCVGWQ